jgi:hypothetical protein
VPTNKFVYNTWTYAQREQLKESKKKDSKMFFYIQQAMHESIFPRIVVATKLKEAWDKLQNAYQGTNKVKTVKIQILRRNFKSLLI